MKLLIVDGLAQQDVVCAVLWDGGIRKENGR